MNPLIALVSALLRIPTVRVLRINFLGLLIIPCFFPALPKVRSPEAVLLKRFFAPDFVFILGISHPTIFQRILKFKEKLTKTHITSSRKEYNPKHFTKSKDFRYYLQKACFRKNSYDFCV